MPEHHLPPSGAFATDDGAADRNLTAALAALAAGTGDLRAVQRALLAARVLVPVVAGVVGAEVPSDGPEGPTAERSAHMAMVTVTGRDGRRALPAFTCVDALARWDPLARPVPLAAADAARGAYAEGAAALLLDLPPAGVSSAPVVIEGPALLALAEARPWLAPIDDPDVVVAIRRALVDLPGLHGIDVEPADDADLRVTLRLAAPTPSGGQNGEGADLGRHVAQAAAARLADVDLLRARLGRGLDIAVVSG